QTLTDFPPVHTSPTRCLATFLSFFLNDTATTEIYTLSLHDALPIYMRHARKAAEAGVDGLIAVCAGAGGHAGLLSPFALIPEIRDRKSTRLNSSHVEISYAVFCLKKKKQQRLQPDVARFDLSSSVSR